MNRKPIWTLHDGLMLIARNEAGKHIVDEGGADIVNEDEQRCFNLFTFLEVLESRVIAVMEGEDRPTGSFRILPSELTRYLWCCLALESGDNPGGTTFRGLPILD